MNQVPIHTKLALISMSPVDTCGICRLIPFDCLISIPQIVECPMSPVKPHFMGE